MLYQSSFVISTFIRVFRLSQWGRRKEKLETLEAERATQLETEKPSCDPVSAQPVDTLQVAHVYDKHSVSANRPKSVSFSRPTSKAVKKREVLTNNRFAEKHLAKRRAVSAKSTADMSSRNVRLCKEQLALTKTEQQHEMKRQYFKLSRPQYLQYIKSATGIVEEDFFADIFPTLSQKPKQVR